MGEVTLTFDNGPEPDTTPEVLESLARRRVLATFFVVGMKLARPGRRALVERTVAAGHWVGNHTYSHSAALGTLPAGEVESQIERTQALLGELAHPDRFFRPRGAEGGVIDRQLLSRAALDLLERDRYTLVLWNAVPRDWEDPHRWVDTALRLLAQVPRAVLVLHDLPTGAMQHLDAFLARALDLGARFVQTFPLECTPILRGVPQAPLDPYVSR
ncbi:MAG: polysaccharide deacetylase family protein [Candidatus Dormibacteraeota bacterium]|nr:polysaccharide deacetylase family protein [Candidatus Dormibacteraeota bacterium]